MLFNSWQFAVFFPVVTAVYFLLPHRVRWAWLLVASSAFYIAFVPAYIGILAITIGVDYVAGRAIEAAPTPARRRAFLFASLAANLGMLAVFKYFNFAMANLAGAAAWLGWHYPVPLLGWLLPIGLSFHVFQSLAYTIEVYRGRQRAERHLGIFALYVMFYPQLVAGPIERPQNLLPQLHEAQGFEYRRVADGLVRMAWGLFKKLVVADRLAFVVGPVFQAPAHHAAPALVLGAVCFAFEIYADFSGYCDIALGAAQVMGFRLMENFKQPYAARSLGEFWHRWHISLSTWFRDYLYVPLGGKRVGPVRWAANVLVVFLASGLWHGASWTYVVWGALHGAGLVVERALGSVARRLGGDRPLPAPLASAVELGRLGLTFAVVCLAWIFFRAHTLADATAYVGGLWAGLTPSAWQPGAIAAAVETAGPPEARALGLTAVVAMVAVEAAAARPHWQAAFVGAPRWARWPAYYALALALVLAGVREARQFIYFQF